MLREELQYKLEQKFGITKGYNIYSQILELSSFVTQNVNKPGFAMDFYDKVYKIMEEKEIKINIPEGYEIDKEKSTLEYIVLKKIEIKLPSTWEEFCKINKSVENEHFIHGDSRILKRKICEYDYRNPNTDKNLLPSKELAEAMLALCQLIQLRDCYNQGWKPDWTNRNNNYCIFTHQGRIYKDTILNINMILAFKTPDLRDKFYNNFRDLIEIAKPLL